MGVLEVTNYPLKELFIAQDYTCFDEVYCKYILFNIISQIGPKNILNFFMRVSIIYSDIYIYIYISHKYCISYKGMYKNTFHWSLIMSIYYSIKLY